MVYGENTLNFLSREARRGEASEGESESERDTGGDDKTVLYPSEWKNQMEETKFLAGISRKVLLKKENKKGTYAKQLKDSKRKARI